MSSPYAPKTLVGFNASAPSDDGSEIESNSLEWERDIVAKIGTPLKDLAEGIDTNVLAAFNSIYGMTEAESDALVTIVNWNYLPGNVYRYGTNTTPGTTVMDTAVQTALTIDQKRVFSNSSDALLITSELTSSIADRVIEGLNLTTDGSISAGDRVLLCTGARTKVNNVRLAGIAGTTNCHGIRCNGIDSEVNNCRVSDLENGAAIGFPSTATGSIVFDCRIHNCAPVVDGAQFGAIECNADKATISYTKFYDCGQTAVSLSGPDFVDLAHLYIEGKTTGSTSGGVIMDGNGVGCTLDHIIVNGCKVEGIQIAGSKSLYTTATRDHSVSYCTLIDCDVSAITLVSGDGDTDSVTGIKLVHNVCQHSITTARALEFVSVSDVDVIDNTVEGYAVGLNSSVGASVNIRVKINNFKNQQTVGMQVYGSDWEVIGNSVEGKVGSTTGYIFDDPTFGGGHYLLGNTSKTCLIGVDGTFSGENRTFIRAHKYVGNATDKSLTNNSVNSSASSILDGTTMAGEAGVGAGAVTVSTAQVLAGDRIRFSLKTAGGTPGVVGIVARTDGVSFGLLSTNGSDTSTYYWWIDR